MRKFFGRTVFLCAAILVLVTVGCTKTQQVLVREPAAAQETIAGQWVLVPEAGTPAPATGKEVSLTFHPDGKLDGFSGCNRFFGGWGFLEGTRDGIRLWTTGSTRMACEPDVMAREHQFTETVGRLSTYSLSKAGLTLYYDDGRKSLRFKR